MSDGERVLLIEDDESLRANVSRYLTDHGFEVHGYGSAEDAAPALASREYRIALVDFRLPGMDGISFLRESKPEHPALPFVVMTAHGDVQSAVDAMKAGADQFLEKPVDPATLLEVIERATETSRLRSEVDRLRAELDDRYGFERLIGRSPGMQKVFERIRLAAPTSSTILVEGEWMRRQDLPREQRLALRFAQHH